MDIESLSMPLAAAASRPVLALPVPAPAQPLYLQVAGHYRQAIQSGVMLQGERMPSVRSLMRLH